MKRSAKFVLPSVLLLVSAVVSHGQIIWGAATNIEGPGDVSTLGTFVSAVTASNTGANQTVGDTLFVRTSNVSGPIITPGAGGDDGFASPDTTSPYATAYNNALEGCDYVGVGQTGTITLGSTSNPLILGHEYQIQIWDSVGYPGRDTTFTDGTSVTLNTASRGQFVLGTFVATALAPTQTITFSSALPTDNYAEFNAISLRDITAAPEPSTYAMMLGGVALLGFCVRRKLQA